MKVVCSCTLANINPNACLNCASNPNRTGNHSWFNSNDFKITPIEPKSKKDMICISKERYEELLKMEQFYIDMCDL